MKWLHSVAGRAFSGDFSALLLKYGYFACIAQHVTLDLEFLCSLLNEPFVKLACPRLNPPASAPCRRHLSHPHLLSMSATNMKRLTWFPNTVNSFYSGPCGDPELVSSLARVRNSGSLFQSNVCNLFLAGILATVRIIGVSVIAGCPQGKS